jgi:AbrB family looped-hinge helix DNA binding protein
MQNHELDMTVQVIITPNGRMSLPADIRKRLGLSGGGALLVEETADGVILRTVAQSIAYAQTLAKRYTGDNDGASVDAFIARRREESGE